MGQLVMEQELIHSRKFFEDIRKRDEGGQLFDLVVQFLFFVDDSLLVWLHKKKMG